MTDSPRAANLLAQLEHLNEQQLRRLLVEHLTKQKLGLYWEANAIERDAALNADVVLPRLVEEWSHSPSPQPSPTSVRGSRLPSPAGGRGAGGEGEQFTHRNLIIEGDNYDSLRLLRATHAGKIRVIYIDPPYNTGNKDWVYNDHYVGANDRWRHSQWLEFLYRRLTLARDLLTPEGVILVSINDENRARLELLMDEVFPGMRVGSLVWRTKDSTSRTESNLSEVHEHILVYGREGFSFLGSSKSTKKYKNPDNDPRGLWNIDPLTVNADRFERSGFFYPLQNPKTGLWYPCDPDRVWAYASELRIKNIDRIRSGSMEHWIREGKIIFPKLDEERVVTWQSIEELREAIRKGDVPVTPKRKKPLLTEDTPDLGFWVGKPVGFGRPGFKKHWNELNSHVNPVCSWISRANEQHDEDDLHVLISPNAGAGTEAIQEILGSRTFAYPKPPGLIQELLRQATQPNDIVLDFFAGSGTTGQAVLELNAEDASTGSAQVGQRRFILCSSTEANSKEPDKNLCRDVCAERMRRVIQGYGGKAGYTVEQGGEFAYLQLDKVEAADAHFEIDAAHAFQLLALKRLGVIRAASAGAVQRLGRVEDCELLVCNEVTPDTIETLAAWPQRHGAARLAIYSTRPKTLSEQLAARGVEANCYSLMDALLSGQRGSAA
ncbi:MAG: DNA methylase N-4 [Gallionellales bacterium GWA2_55_18]|nr:MAG: DNA methylase N-4 [Gallionellales bacterium GWA2_55_18]